MKNLIYIVLFSILPMLTYAQIDVVEPGNVGIGTDSPDEKLHVVGDTKTEGIIIEKINTSASVLCNRTTASAFAFGAGVQAGFTVDKNFHMEFRSNTRANVLNRSISIGTLLLRFRKNSGWAGFGVGNPASKLHVNGSITYNGSLNNASDRRLKSNINDFKYGLDEILQLNPVNFRYNGKGGIKNAGKDQVGLVAQDLKKVAPELVSTFTYEEENEEAKVVSSEDYLMISESSIKYMLINAVKEQQETITTLEERISKMEALLNNNTDLPNTSQTVELGVSGQLLQNQPNPFNETTTIKYTLPQNSKDATMQIMDMNGRVIKTAQLSDVRSGELVIKAEELGAGTYTYTLIVDGQVVDTKKMVLTK